jgi:hypothetical protein
MQTNSTTKTPDCNPAIPFYNAAYENFLEWEAKSRDTIDFKKVYVDIAGDVLAGLLLSQLVYWHLPSKKGENRLTIERDGFFWLAKSREDWWEELRMTPREVDRGLKLLRAAGVIETNIWHFHGKQTVHIRIVPLVFMDAINSVSKGDRGRAKKKFTRTPSTPRSLISKVGPDPETVTSNSLNSNLQVTKQGNPDNEIGNCYISENTSEITTKEYSQRLSPSAPAGGTSPSAEAHSPELGISSSLSQSSVKIKDKTGPQPRAQDASAFRREMERDTPASRDYWKRQAKKEADKAAKAGSAQ